MKLNGQKYGFELERDLVHYTNQVAGGAFENRWLKIWFDQAAGKWRLDLREEYHHDGCTGVPDARGTKEAAPFHDAGYQFAEAIARAWGWTVARVLRWFDRVFLERMLQDQAAAGVAISYFIGVRIFGFYYHTAARLIRRVINKPLGVTHEH